MCGWLPFILRLRCAILGYCTVVLHFIRYSWCTCSILKCAGTQTNKAGRRLQCLDQISWGWTVLSGCFLGDIGPPDQNPRQTKITVEVLVIGFEVGVVSIIVSFVDFNVHSGCKPITQILFSTSPVVGFQGEKGCGPETIVLGRHLVFN